MTKFEDKALTFATALSDVYRKPEERSELRELKLEEESLTEDFTAMLWGLMTVYCSITGEKLDVLDFINILTRLAFQHSMAEGDA